MLGTVAVALVLVGTVYAVARGLAKQARSRGPGTVLVLVRLQLLVTAFGGLLLQWVDRPGAAVSGAVGGAPGAAGAALTNVVLGAGTTVAALVAVGRGLRPFHEAHNDYTVRPRHRRRKLVVTTVVVVSLSVLVECLAVGVLDRPGWLAGAAAVGYYGYTAAMRSLYLVSPERLRDPTDRERARIERALDRVDRPTGTVVVFEAAEPRTAVAVAGEGDTRLVWVHDEFLAAADDETLAVALAQADAIGDSRFLDYYFLLRTLLFGGVATLLGGVATTDALVVGVGLTVIAVGVVYFPLFSVLSRRVVHRTDEAVARTFGAGTVADVYEAHAGDITWLSQTHWDKPVLRHVVRYVGQEPRMAVRLDRLDDREAAGSGGSPAADD